MGSGGDAEHVFYTRLVNDLAIYGIGLAKRERTLARLQATLEQYRKQPATFGCMLVPRRPPGPARAGCRECRPRARPPIRSRAMPIDGDAALPPSSTEARLRAHH